MDAESDNAIKLMILYDLSQLKNCHHDQEDIGLLRDVHQSSFLYRDPEIHNELDKMLHCNSMLLSTGSWKVSYKETEAHIKQRIMMTKGKPGLLFSLKQELVYHLLI